ncbi:hypothetical protein N7452_010678 [Penicillium brevicompactum]|uniref:Uncharacterized protein n=1 Tax=Penicillium brevicompactum TaxID=5074 RepID=A0A9W9Q159_PENBR|nr:hypothetical protein N7452_010678 [Penicillium brevicompactum]
MTVTNLGKRLLGKVAIVTGGSSGYGAGIAKKFVEQGAKVCIADRHIEGAERLARDTPGISVQRMDVTMKKDWTQLGQRLMREHGHIDCLINNAGTTYHNKPTLEVTEEDFDRCFNVNVKSIFWSTAELMPIFKQNPSGASIVNIGSVGATRPRPGLVWYNGSKAAVSNATKGLAAEYGPFGIRVNSVCPLLGVTGLINLRFQAFAGVEDTPENKAQFTSNVPLGRLCEASDVANACLYFASDESKFVTGINMDVDGGRCV